MAKIFLDTNIYIDIITNRIDRDLEKLQGNEIYLSPLSIHILVYVYKYIIPDKELKANRELFNIVSFNSLIAEKALIGPTNDFVDNVQLHSEASAECNMFLTENKDVLDMKFFGKTQVIATEDLH